MILAIEANNIRSDGGIIFLKKIIQNINLNNRRLKKIYIWGEEKLLQELPNSKKIVKNKIFLTNINFINIFIRFFWHFFLLNKEIIKKKCDVIYFPGGINLANIKNTKTIISILNIEPFFYEKYSNYNFGFKKMRLFLLKKIIIFSAKKSTAIIYLNDYFKKYFENKIDKKTINSICSLGASTNYNVIKKQKSIKFYSDNNRYIIGYVSTIFPYKNHIQLIKVIKKIIQEGTPVSLIMIGKCHDQQLLKKINKLIIDERYIIYLDYLNKTELKKYYKNIFDLKIFPSSSEAFPNIIIEAIDYNLPLLCSSIQPMPSILKKSCEYFDPLNEKDMYKKIMHFLKSPKKRLSNIKKAKKLIKQNYSWKKSAENFLNLIEKISNEKTH
jgi:glycosyltransferase involved in cell wall biosynthesis